MRRAYAIACAAMLALGTAMTGVARAAVTADAHPGYADWAVNAAEPGPSLPPDGRSLFDHLTTNRRGGHDLPFPLITLLEQIARRARCVHAERGAYRECYRAVLIPLGRSLQRSAARDAHLGAEGDRTVDEDFFRYPRAVFAVVGDDAREPGAPLTKDRLYLGYHEAGEIIEVISYNEAAGRFEFQIVKDYRAGGAAKVFYANRAICIACHQNHAPIFSRQVWDETNANPAIAQRLLASGRAFYGVKVDRGVDIPQAIDAGVDRANRFAAQQLLWQRGCGGDDARARRCRGAAFTAALQYALSGELGYDASGAEWLDHFVATFGAQWPRNWPNGLKLPDAGVPNRDPLLGPQSAQLAHVAAKFEALQARPHSSVWQQEAAQRELVVGIAASLAHADVVALNNALTRKRVGFPASRHAARCAVQAHARRIEFDCASDDERLRLHGRLQRAATGAVSGAIDQMRLPDGETLSGLTLRAVKRPPGGGYSAELVQSELPSAAALPVRNRRGQRLARFTLGEPSGGRTTASVTVVEDFSALRAAVQRIVVNPGNDAFSDLPFRRARVMSALWRELGNPARAACCEDHTGMPPAQTSPAPASETAEAGLAPFLRYCATCHQSNERTPPNFLRADAQPAAKKIEHCAQRIYYRLAMWQLTPQAREKTPMPPQIALQSLYPHAADWPRSEELRAMQTYAARAIKDFDERALLAQPYETLRGCLPARSSLGAQQ
jgi:mono/diheme cytochrome c family protein